MLLCDAYDNVLIQAVSFKYVNDWHALWCLMLLYKLRMKTFCEKLAVSLNISKTHIQLNVCKEAFCEELFKVVYHIAI